MPASDNVLACKSCGLQPEYPNRIDADGQCAACKSLREPGMLERLAANAMPPCFEGTRAAVVQLAALAIELRGGARN